MSIEFKLPELGENIESGDVVNVLVQEGDTIAANDGVIELETDKAVVEIPCPHGGRVAKLHVKKGDTAKVGQTLLTIEPEEAEAPPSAAAEEKPAPASAAPAVIEPKTAKAAEVKAAQAQPGEKTAAPPASTGPIPAGPAARRIAREMQVDLASVAGSGKHGRITPEDVAAAKSPARQAAAPAAARPAGPPPITIEAVTPPGEPGQDAWGTIRQEKLPRIRKTIAEQMVRSATTIPHVTNFDDADVTDLEHVRASVPPGLLGDNLKLTMMPFVMKAVALALRRHPIVNATLDEANDRIVYKEYVNLGIAVDTPRGLVVPNIRNADRLGIGELAKAVADLAERARGAQFAVEDLRGGTFTISNLGAVGGTYSTPIINHPEVAILLLGRARWLPTVRGENHDRIEPRLMMPLSLSFDHRLVDGAAAGRFLNDVIRYLQAPGVLLLA